MKFLFYSLSQTNILSMFKNTFFLFFLLFAQMAAAQSEYFEGFILYEYQYYDLDGKDITEMMGPLHGREQHYYINAGNYKAFDENGNLIQLYNSRDNSYYFNRAGKLFQLDAGQTYSDPPKFSKISKRKKIAGYTCKGIESQNDSETPSVYFVSDKLKIHTAAFLEHNLGNWNDFLRVSQGSIFLEYIGYKADHYIVMTAKQIKPMKLPDSEFELEKYL
ncbi:hypothetical protein [Pararhodonellum marinum]|uniref:hypothetical protein n=1 Tax=Pararhodonellum marinum TaxID=2755358 RepID=UPI00188FB751|nr:hypothetical protein [Pararhodonellum marinum]